MKFKVDGVGLLVWGAFLLLAVAFGSLWWTGQGRFDRPTLNQTPPETKLQVDDTAWVDKDLPVCLNHPLWRKLNRKLVDLYRRKQFLGAIKTAKEALQTAERIFGTEHPVTAIAANNLALVYLRQDRCDEALWLFKQARSIVTEFIKRGEYQNLNLKELGLLNQSSEYKMWVWPTADFKVAGIEPGMSEEAVRKILGEPSPAQETPIPDPSQKSANGEELIYPQFSLSFSGTGTEIGLRQIKITGNNSATSRGIQVGDSKVTALWVYGPPVKEEPGLMEYRRAEGTVDKPLERYIQLTLDTKEAVQVIEIGVR